MVTKARHRSPLYRSAACAVALSGLFAAGSPGAPPEPPVPAEKTADAPSGPTLDRRRELAAARGLAAGRLGARVIGVEDVAEGPVLVIAADPRHRRGSVILAGPAGFALGEHALEAALTDALAAAGFDSYTVQAPLLPAGRRAASSGDAAWTRLLQARVAAACRAVAHPEQPVFFLAVGTDMDLALPALDAVGAGPEMLKLAALVGIDAVPGRVGSTIDAAGESEPASFAEALAARAVPLMLVTTSGAPRAPEFAVARALAVREASPRTVSLPELGPRRSGLETGLVQRVLGFFHHVLAPRDGASERAASA